MATGHIPQIFLWITVQNQLRVAQRVVIDKVVQFRLLRHGHIQCILNPGTVNGNFSPIPVRVLSALRHLYSCNLCDTVFLLIRFRTHSRLERAGACRGEPPPSCWRKTALPLKSPTGAFIAAQPRHSHFRRKQKIRTLLLSRKGSDFHCLVRIRGLEPPPSCPD